MKRTVTFNINRDMLSHLINFAAKHGIDFGDYSVRPMKIRTRVTVTVARSVMYALYDKAYEYMMDGNDYIPYSETHRALYGHYPYRLPCQVNR